MSVREDTGEEYDDQLVEFVDEGGVTLEQVGRSMLALMPQMRRMFETPLAADLILQQLKREGVV